MAMPRLEPLEVRRLFVVGTAGDDVILMQAVNGDSATVRIILNTVIVFEQTFTGGPSPIAEIFGQAGNDLITVDPKLQWRALVHGGDGNDTIVGGSQSDVLIGEGGDDLILGKLGADEITGGAGNDTLRGGGGVDVLWGDDSIYDGTHAAGADLLFGEDGSDRLNGGDGNDLLNGGAGDDDSLKGGNGVDQIYGGDGNDGFYLTRSSGFNLDGGNDLIDGGNGSDRLTVDAFDAVKVSLDGVANDGVAGDAVNVMPTIETIGVTRLGGGSLIDASKAPGAMNISINDNAFDRTIWVTVIGSPFADTISVSAFGPVQIDGRAGDDVIRGASLPRNTIYGGAGNDQLFGGNDNDVIVGEDGDDFIEAGPGSDRIAAGVGNDTVFGDLRNPLGIDNPTFYGSDTIEGNAGNDVLNGGGNNDVILGEGGNDTIIGGGGNDHIFGGPDAADHIFGGSGTDSAAHDDKDTYDSIEVLLT